MIAGALQGRQTAPIPLESAQTVFGSTPTQKPELHAKSYVQGVPLAVSAAQTGTGPAPQADAATQSRTAGAGLTQEPRDSMRGTLHMRLPQDDGPSQLAPDMARVIFGSLVRHHLTGLPHFTYPLNVQYLHGLVLALLAASSTSCASPDDPMSHWTVGAGPLATVSGKAFVFGPSGGQSIEGATISVAEAPAYATTVAADGTFSFQVPSGRPVSLQLQKELFHTTQSATLDLGPAGLDQVGFQVPTDNMFDLLTYIVDIYPDPERCQIATTVSRKGTEPYGGAGLGEPGVVVSVDPPLPAESGPIYFEYVSETLIYPTRSLTETSIDGGVLFVNVPEGEYTLSATKVGKTFSTATIRCRAGILVNAAPPRGLQEL